MAYQVGLMEWAEACKIVTDRPSMAQRTLDAAHEELIEKGFLKNVEYLGRGKKKMLQYTFGEAFIPPDPALLQELADLGVTRPARCSWSANTVSRPWTTRWCAARRSWPPGTSRARNRLSSWTF